MSHVDDVDAKAAKNISFEEALGQLEKTVDSMESGDVPLAELLAKFESGSQLLQICEARLKDAELKIEQLKKQANAPTLARFESDKDAD